MSLKISFACVSLNPFRKLFFVNVPEINEACILHHVEYFERWAVSDKIYEISYDIHVN
jgi:hypothetical protein